MARSVRRMNGGYRGSKSGSRSKKSKKSRGSNNIFSINTLKSLISLGIAGMVAMYLASWFMALNVVSATSAQIATITGLTKTNIAYAIKGTTLATIAIRFHKVLDKMM